MYGKPLAMKATVNPASATGLVTFYDGTIVLGQATLNSGVAQLTTILLQVGGTRSLKAHYVGDATFAASTSASIAQTITAAPESGFHQTVAFQSGAFGSSVPIAVGDFNGDGKADVALVALNGSVTILLGDGNGGLSMAVGNANGVGPVGVASLAVGDFNGDGKLDLAVVNLQSGNGAFLYVFLGDGNGGLTVTAGSPQTKRWPTAWSTR